MSVLDEIIAHKREEVEASKKRGPLKEEKAKTRPSYDVFSRALVKPGRISIIAEIKRASPSAGVICPSFEPERIAGIYKENGASAISILTESHFFKGNIDYLPLVKKATNLPVLRKDFIIDPYQVYESNIYGADAILLIAAVLSFNELGNLLRLTKQLGMEALVEVHNKDDLEKAISIGANIIGINNRDLKSLKVDLKASLELIKYIPKEKIAVTESGINNREELLILKEAGFNAALIGTSLMQAKDIGKKLREFTT